MKKTAVYVRISQDRSGEGLGVERQREDCEALVVRRGWTTVELFVDNDISASSAKARPAFDRMVQGIRDGRFDAVVTYRSDRLYRQVRQLEGLVDLVNEKGIEIDTVASGGLNLTTADGRFVARMLGSASQHESEAMGERIRREKAKKAELGLPNGGPRPFGYKSDLITIDEAEATIVLEAASRVISGESLMSVTRDLVRRGVTTSTGKQWRHKSLGNILMGPRWAGLRQHNGSLRPAVWKGILTVEQHHLLCVLLAPQRRTRPVRRHLLTGLVWCTRCGGRMEGHLRKEQPEYRCPGEFGLGTGCRRRIRGDIEQDVVSRVLMLLSKDLEYFLPRIDRPFVDISGLLQRRDQLAAKYAAGTLSESEWQAARAVVQRAVEDAEAIHAAQAQESPLVTFQRGHDDIRATWDELVITQQRAILQAVIDRIEVGEGRVGMNTYDPARVTVRTKSVRISDEEPLPEPEVEHLEWDWERDRLAHEGVFLSRGLSASVLKFDDAGSRPETTRIRVEQSPNRGTKPPFVKPAKPLRRGVEEAKKAGEAST